MINEDLPPCSPNKATDVCVLLAYSPILHMKTEGDPHKVPVSWTVNVFFSFLFWGRGHLWFLVALLVAPVKIWQTANICQSLPVVHFWGT